MSRPVGPNPDGIVCEVCGARADPVVQRSRVQTWSPLFLHNVSHEGKLFNTKQELKQYCREHKLESGALL